MIDASFRAAYGAEKAYVMSTGDPGNVRVCLSSSPDEVIQNRISDCKCTDCKCTHLVRHLRLLVDSCSILYGAGT